MNLYLMRHGLAVERGTPGYDNDGERPLTPKGERKVRRVAEALLQMEVVFEVILSSPLVRARQTAEALLAEVKAPEKLQLTEHLAPGGRAKELVKLIQELPGPPQNVLLVGHEPDLGQFASLLLSGGEAMSIPFKKGGVARLTVDRWRASRCASLEWLLTSRQMEMMT